MMSQREVRRYVPDHRLWICVRLLVSRLWMDWKSRFTSGLRVVVKGMFVAATVLAAQARQGVLRRIASSVEERSAQPISPQQSR
jgi:hypothetical protein